MATTGKAAWEKYYMGKGDIPTSVKKETIAWDPKTPSVKLGIVPAGLSVTVVAVNAYDAKTLIKFTHEKKDYSCRVKIDDLQKPGIKTASNVGNVKTIPNKALTPDGLKLAGKVIQKRDYVRIVNESIKACNTVPLPVKDFMYEFLEKSIKKDSAQLSPIVRGLTEPDVKIVSKDFGELAGAWWFVNNYDPKLSFIEFPAKSNEPLVDYYVGYPNGIKLKVSAKSDKGAAPSLNSIWETIKNKTFANKDKEVHDFMGTIVNNNGLESIILASKHFGSTGYKAVSALIGKTTYTSDDVEEWLKDYNNADLLYKKLNDSLYSKISRKVDVPSIKKILDTPKARRCGIILSPMAYNLVDEVNKDSGYTSFLSKVCKSMNVEQLYVTIKPKSQSLTYTLKGFKDNNFIFEYHSNSANPGGNKIGFMMDV
jgi:hypothetical protein